MADAALTPMTHTALIAAIAAMADDRGLVWHYCPDGRHCDGAPGLPDLMILGSWHALFREVKTADGRRTLAQVRYHDRMARAGLDVATWRERDLANGRVEKELDAIMRVG